MISESAYTRKYRHDLLCDKNRVGVTNHIILEGLKLDSHSVAVAVGGARRSVAHCPL